MTFDADEWVTWFDNEQTPAEADIAKGVLTFHNLGTPGMPQVCMARKVGAPAWPPPTTEEH